MNKDLRKERATATFNVERVTNLLDGGQDRTERRRHLEAVIHRDPTGIFDNDNNPYLHRTERHVRATGGGRRALETASDALFRLGLVLHRSRGTLNKTPTRPQPRPHATALPANQTPPPTREHESTSHARPHTPPPCRPIRRLLLESTSQASQTLLLVPF